MPTAAIIEDALQQELMQVSVRQVLHENAQWLRLAADSEHLHNVVVLDIRHQFGGFLKFFSKRGKMTIECKLANARLTNTSFPHHQPKNSAIILIHASGKSHSTNRSIVFSRSAIEY